MSMHNERPKELVGLLFAGFWLLIIAALAFGWISNIVKLAHMDWNAALSILGVLRIVGVLAAPLGVILGYV